MYPSKPAPPCVPVIRCHTHPQAYAFLTALLEGTAYRPVRATHGDAGDVKALLLTVYQPSARERRPCAGIRQLAQWRRDGERAPALVCAFRSKQRLLRFPANALLGELGTTFLRLPCRREAVCAALEVAQPLSPQALEDVVHGACTSWGQLAHYIDRMIQTAERSADGEETPDFAMLRAFARRRFGDWLGETLTRAESCRARGDTDAMVRLLREARSRAPEAAVYRTFGALAHGREADLSNKGLGPLRVTLLSMQQGIVGTGHLDQLLASDSWIDFTAALQSAARTLTLTRSGPVTLPDALRAEVGVFLQQFDALLRMTEPRGDQQPAAAMQPAAAIEIIDDLQEASRSVLRRRNDARQRAGPKQS